MKRKRLLELIGEIGEEYMEEIYMEDENIWAKKVKAGQEVPKGSREKAEGGVPKGSRRKFLYGATAVCAAACFFLLAGSIFAGRLSGFSGRGEALNGALVNGVQTGNFFGLPTSGVRLEDEELYLAGVRVGERVAVYKRAEVYAMEMPNVPQLDVTTIMLKEKIGEFYQEEKGRRWYRLKDRNNMSALIGEEENGLLRLWEYECFLVASVPEERVEGVIYFADQYPDADLSPYPYGEMFSVIYGLTGAAEIESITAEAITVNNLDIGKEIQRQVGSYTYQERAQIESIYDAIVNVLCNGGSGDRSNQENRFTYRFSTDAEDKVSSGETTYGSRSLRICMADGTVIGQLKYDALKGCIYQFYGISSEFLAEEAVETLNGIFGIE